MTENNLAALIRGVCHDVGKMKGIEFHLPATWGMKVPGRWEAGYKIKATRPFHGDFNLLVQCGHAAARRSHFALGVPAHIGTMEKIQKRHHR